jgi:hypothetical protein
MYKHADRFKNDNGKSNTNDNKSKSMRKINSRNINKSSNYDNRNNGIVNNKIKFHCWALRNNDTGDSGCLPHRKIVTGRQTDRQTDRHGRAHARA